MKLFTEWTNFKGEFLPWQDPFKFGTYTPDWVVLISKIFYFRISFKLIADIQCPTPPKDKDAVIEYEYKM